MHPYLKFTSPCPFFPTQVIEGKCYLHAGDLTVTFRAPFTFRQKPDRKTITFLSGFQAGRVPN